jgi:hypothetical protein
VFPRDVKDIQLANKPIRHTEARHTPGSSIPRVMSGHEPPVNQRNQGDSNERVKVGPKADASNFLNHPFQTGSGILTHDFGWLSSFENPLMIRIRAYIISSSNQSGDGLKSPSAGKCCPHSSLF